MTRFSVSAAKASVVLDVLSTINLQTIQENMDIVITMAVLWGLYLSGLLASTLVGRYERSRSWYDPNEYIRKYTALGFLVS